MSVEYGAYVISWRACQCKLSHIFLTTHFYLKRDFCNLTSAITSTYGY